MKADRNSVEGQLDIFEAMNRAAEAVDRMMENEKADLNRIGERREECIKGSDMHAAMQKTFLNPNNDDFATVAYIDYRMVYVRDWNSPATLRRFEDSRAAVEYYMEQMERICRMTEAEVTSEHEPFVDVACVEENLYMECE